MTARTDGPLLPDGYAETLADIETRVAASRNRALLRVNAELILLYWQIGGLILERQRSQGWGTRVIERLSADLRRAFPDQQGFSARNLAYMRNFAAAWPDETILQQLAAKIPWGHHQLLLDRLDDGLSEIERELEKGKDVSDYQRNSADQSPRCSRRKHESNHEANEAHEEEIRPRRSKASRCLWRSRYPKAAFMIFMPFMVKLFSFGGNKPHDDRRCSAKQASLPDRPFDPPLSPWETGFSRLFLRETSAWERVSWVAALREQVAESSW